MSAHVNINIDGCIIFAPPEDPVQAENIVCCIEFPWTAIVTLPTEFWLQKRRMFVNA